MTSVFKFNVMEPLRMHYIKYYSMNLLKSLYVDTSLIVCKMWSLLRQEEEGEKKRGRGGRGGGKEEEEDEEKFEKHCLKKLKNLGCKPCKCA